MADLENTNVNEQNLNENEDTKGNKPNTKVEKEETLEEKIQRLLIENEKLKRATDKATSQASEFKKQLRAKQTEDEIALQDKAEKELEREERMKALERENAINKLEKNFILLGYDEKQANDSATAQYDGDTDTLFRIQSEVQANMLKQKESEWLASRPQVNSGNGNTEEEDFFLKGFNK